MEPPDSGPTIDDLGSKSEEIDGQAKSVMVNSGQQTERLGGGNDNHNADGGEEGHHHVHECRRTMSLSLPEMKEQACLKLHIELKKAQEELKLRDQEVAKLSDIKDKVESELEDLTASLFEEANKMVYEANVQRARSEKELHEANMKIDVLQAEVQALKMLVLTSTPSKPNVHLHPHIDTSWQSPMVGSGARNGVKAMLSRTSSGSRSLFKKSPSTSELAIDGQATLNANGTVLPNDAQHQTTSDDNTIDSDGDKRGEVDPMYQDEFLEWKKAPTFDPIESQFMKRIYDEEIYPLFNFKNSDLTAMVLRAIEDSSIIVEAVADKSPFPKRCALLDSPRNCKYRMKVGDDWFNISLLCRNRIAAVCDLFCYLRYIKQGLVKSSYHEIYWEIMRKRKTIALARLGFVCC